MAMISKNKLNSKYLVQQHDSSFHGFLTSVFFYFSQTL